MRKFNKATIAVAIVTTCGFVFSCTDQEVRTDEKVISKAVVTKFKDLGFDVTDIRLVPDHNPITGNSGKYNYLLEGDIVITPENLEAMSSSDVHYVGAVGEQYRTNNLVSGLPRTIRVLGYNGGSNALTSKMRTALSWAVDNYNALNTNLSYTLTYGSNTTGYDIVVYKTTGAAGGVAGFPSGGNPYKWVQIFSGTDSYDTNVVEHVITHEMGHCHGMRHTDYFNRSLSCGSGGNEGAGTDGAIHVPGTPTGFDANSIMLACFGSSEDGEFGTYDRVALEYLY